MGIMKVKKGGKTDRDKERGRERKERKRLSQEERKRETSFPENISCHLMGFVVVISMLHLTFWL